MVEQAPLYPIRCEREAQWQDNVNHSEPVSFEQAETYLVETMFYDEWAPSGEILVSKSLGTFMPRWGDLKNDSKLDLRELLE